MAGIVKRGGMYYAIWRQDGKNVLRSTKIPVKHAGITPGKCREMARAAAAQMERVAKGETLARAGMDAIRRVAETMGAGAGVPSVRQWLENYAPSAGEKTEKNRRRAFNVFLEYLGERADMRLDALTPAIMRDFIAWALHRVARGTVGLYRQALSSAFNRAVDDDILLKSPMPRMNLAREAAAAGVDGDKTEREPFTPEELRLMVHHFPAPWNDMVLVSFLTGGQRLGDICRLQWQNIDFRNDTISIHPQKTTGKIIDLPLMPELRARLLLIKSEQGEDSSGYVFPFMARRHILQAGSISSEFTALLKAWGIVKNAAPGRELAGRRRRVSPKSFHSIRHSVVSIARCNSAFTPDMVRAVVGHDSECIERGYFKADMAGKNAVLDSLARVVSESGM